MSGQAAGERFNQKVSEELARRAGHRCSMPACRAPTSGPSATLASGASSVGVAAHITAASPGGPRYDQRLSPDERRSASNGIWLCQTHAKQIDDDEARFPRDLLRAWREAAEHRAGLDQGWPESTVSPEASRRLVAYSRVLEVASEDVRFALHAFLANIGAPRAWGERYELGRMALYEIAVNAATHGQATRIELNSDGNFVSIRDDGELFSPIDLRRGGRGGNRAIRDLDDAGAGTFTLVYRSADNRNEWSLVDEVLARGENVPCSIRLEYGSQNRDVLVKTLLGLADCPEIHLYPGELWSYSDWAMLLAELSAAAAETAFVVHGVKHNEHLATFVAETLPSARIAD